MNQHEYDITKDDLNPTFLFTWKGTKMCDEKNYHNHDYIELAVILSGKGKYNIKDEIYTVEEGDVIILNPQINHQSLLIDKSNPTVEFFVGFSDVHFQNMLDNHLELKTGSPILHMEGELKRKIFKICMAMEAENAEMRPGTYFMMKAYLIQLLTAIVREQTDPVQIHHCCSFESVSKKYVVEQIINYFEEHYNEKISLDRIAENMYLSPFYISKIFKSETGDPPINYLIKVRLEKAKELLETGRIGSVQTVAEAVGYDDAYHFSKLFKKHFGVSPSQIKR